MLFLSKFIMISHVTVFQSFQSRTLINLKSGSKSWKNNNGQYILKNFVIIVTLFLSYEQVWKFQYDFRKIPLI